MELMDRFLNNSSHPDDEIGCKQMHQPKMWITIALIDIQSWVHYDGDHLENNKNDCEEAVESVENINTVRMKINDEVGCEFKKVIDEGTNSKHESSLAKKGTAM